jgi:hypothetical protein
MSTRDDLLELLREWRQTCKQTGLPYTDEDAASFAAEAYPFNRIDRVADLEAAVKRVEAFCSGLEAEDDYLRSWKCARQLRRALVGDETPGTGEHA